ncbi:MAG: hypothetical protein ACR652_14590 [Methylocystis sp.]|uniref:hypothetical protein n=1 Tax=Methylocystis sp. TaxID=1911079 RepID=UPI003DA2FC58
MAGARDGLRPTNIRIPREVLDWAAEIHERAGGAGTPAIYVETSTGGLTFICGDSRQRLVLDEEEYEEALSAEGEGGESPVFAFEWSEEPRSKEDDALRKAADQAHAAFLNRFYRIDSISSEDTLSTSTSSDTSSSSDDDVPSNWLGGAFGQGGRVSHNNANADGSGSESGSDESSSEG